MSWWSDFAEQIEQDAPVGRLTWFRLGGSARYLFRPRDLEQLSSLVVRARNEGVPLKILGRGANVLVSDDGFDGVVVRLDAPSFRRIAFGEGTAEVGGGVDLTSFTRLCVRRGLSGLEPMAGIPATIGGAVRMNAGGAGRDRAAPSGGRAGGFGDVVRSVVVLEPDGRLASWSAQQCGFGYRRSAVGDRVVVSATLALVEDDPRSVRERFEQRLDMKMKSQPLADHSAGCVFKNPPGESAGALIDRAGLKGLSYGLARVSQRHANFIVADSGASASDVLRLIDLVRDRVREVFNIQLELEIDVWQPVGEVSLV